MFFSLPGDFSQFHFDLCTFPLHWFINTFFLCDLWECFCHINKWRGEKLTQILKHFYIHFMCVTCLYVTRHLWEVTALHTPPLLALGTGECCICAQRMPDCCLPLPGFSWQAALWGAAAVSRSWDNPACFWFLLNLYQSLSRRSQSIWILLSYIQWNTDSKGIHHVPKLPLLKVHISMFTINRMLF